MRAFCSFRIWVICIFSLRRFFAFWHEEENIGENSDGDDAAADDDGIPANCWTEGGKNALIYWMQWEHEQNFSREFILKCVEYTEKSILKSWFSYHKTQISRFLN